MREIETRGAGVRVEAELSRRLAAAGGWLGVGTVSSAERALRHAIYAQLAPGRL